MIWLWPLFSLKIVYWLLSNCCTCLVTEWWQPLFWPIARLPQNFKGVGKIFSEITAISSSRSNLEVSPDILLGSNGDCSATLQYLRCFSHLPTPFHSWDDFYIATRSPLNHRSVTAQSLLDYVMSRQVLRQLWANYLQTDTSFKTVYDAFFSKSFWDYIWYVMRWS